MSISSESDSLLFNIDRAADALGAQCEMLRDTARLLEKRIVRESQSVWGGPSREAVTKRAADTISTLRSMATVAENARNSLLRACSEYRGAAERAAASAHRGGSGAEAAVSREAAEAGRALREATESIKTSSKKLESYLPSLLSV